MTSHVRIEVIQAGRRIADSRGSAGRTICGAEITDRDLTLADARRLRPDTIDQFHVCQMCLARIPAEDR